MQKNKLILSHCPNFYKIIDFEFYEDDIISERLINIYKDYIFSIDETNDDFKLIEKLDHVINKYIDDYYFRREMQNKLLNIRVKSSDNIVKSIIERILSIFDSYETGYTRNIYFARWI